MLLETSSRKEAIQTLKDWSKDAAKSCKEEGWKVAEKRFEALYKAFKKLSPKGELTKRQYNMIENGMWWQTSDAWEEEGMVIEYVAKEMERILKSLKK